MLIKVIKRFSHKWVQPKGYDTGIKIYNCIVKEKVPFIIRNKEFVTWYTCGPTVYDSSHIGHASCYVKLDIIQRILKHHYNLNLVTVMNITDIDDKIIKRSLETKQSTIDIVERYEKEFWNDLNLLGVKKPDIIVRVTDNINVIINFIKELINSGYAYRSKDGSVYFDSHKLKNYGKLQNISKSDDNDAHDFKRSSTDFALWKSVKPNEPYWEADWGPGRPGWHIECSALAGTVIGNEIDVHAGGIDLRFPHHENEEAQSCAYFSKPQWVNYWIHTGHLQLKHSIKMSKSLKNTIGIADMLKTYSSEDFRMACLMSHYSKNMEFSDELMKSAQKTLQGYKNFVTDCSAFIKGHLKSNINNDILKQSLSKLSQEINNAFSDNFDTAMALKNLSAFINTVNKMLHSSTSSENELSDKASMMASVSYVMNIFDNFGIDLDSKAATAINKNNFENIMNNFVEFRENVRLAALEDKNTKYLKFCDDIRDSLKQYGIIIKDYRKKSSQVM